MINWIGLSILDRLEDKDIRTAATRMVEGMSVIGTKVNNAVAMKKTIERDD